MRYAESIIQSDTGRCFLCGRRDQKLDRHEPFGGALRRKSQRLGMWVALCHERCHLGGAHRSAELERELSRAAQEAAMREYGWTEEEFRREFYKSFL